MLLVGLVVLFYQNDMKKIIALLTLTLLCIAAKPGGGGSPGWKVFNTNLRSWTAVNAPTPSPGDVATTPISGVYANYTALLTTNLVGNIAGKTITATFTVTADSGDPDYVYGLYQLQPGRTPSVRLYFSTRTDYTDSARDVDNFWFAQNWVQVDDFLGTVTISATVQPANWRQGGGHLGSEPAYTGIWMNAAANVKAVGFAFGSMIGDSGFYDVGVGVVNGTATFHLQSFTVSP